MKRYEIWSDVQYWESDEEPNGEWVKYEDVAPLEAAILRLLKAVCPQCEPLPDTIGQVTQIDNYIAGQQARIRELEHANNGWIEMDKKAREREQGFIRAVELLARCNNNLPPDFTRLKSAIEAFLKEIDSCTS